MLQDITNQFLSQIPSTIDRRRSSFHVPITKFSFSDWTKLILTRNSSCCQVSKCLARGSENGACKKMAGHGGRPSREKKKPKRKITCRGGGVLQLGKAARAQNPKGCEEKPTFLFLLVSTHCAVSSNIIRWDG